MIFITQKSDILGAVTSLLCLIHCIATPVFFIAQTHSATCCEHTVSWWPFIDYFFLVISFFAVYRSTRTTAIHWIKSLLWLSWSALCIVIINEKLAWFALGDSIIYMPTLALVTLHLYKQKYCNCTMNKCCTHEK